MISMPRENSHEESACRVRLYERQWYEKHTSRLYHSLECYKRVNCITYLFHDRRSRASIGLRLVRSVTIQWSGLWDVVSLQTLLRDRRQKYVVK